MDIKKKKLKGYIALSVLIIVCMIMASAMTFFAQSNSAEAITDMDSQATNLGNLLIDGYADDTTGKGNVFEGEVFWELIKMVSGGAVTNKTQLNSWIIATGQEKTSSDFRSYNDKLGNGTNDIVVTIGGKQWIATYLSQSEPTQEYPNGTPILTFWLANNDTKSRWSFYSNDNNRNYNNSWQNQYTSNLYGTSFIRTQTLNNGGWMAKLNTEKYPSNSYDNVTKSTSSEWAIYTVPNTTAGMKGSLTEFIEVPNNVSWQKEQQALKYVTSSDDTDSYGYNNNNDALKYGSQNTVGGTTGQGTALNYKDRLGTSLESYYTAWGNDTLWLPSVTETGVSGEEGIWKASNYTRANSTYSWLRSAVPNRYAGSYSLATDGSSILDTGVWGTAAVRPAFHLNLSEAAKRADSLGLDPPQDVSNPYNGKEQSLDDITDTDKTGWFDSTKMRLDSLDGEIKDVGTYQVKATITSTDENDVFVGTPDPSKGNGDESDKIRYFNFTITKKQIECVVEPAQGGGGYVVKPKVVDNDPDANKIYDTDTGNRAPTFTITYTNTKTGVPSTEYPTAVGTYSVTVTMNENRNYELKGTCKAADDLVITAKPVTKPSLSTLELPYNGSIREFTVNGVSDDVSIVATTDGLKFEDGKLKAKNAGTYYAKVSLVDTSATAWEGGGTSSYNLSVTITQKAITITIVGDAMEWNWGDSKPLTVTVNGLCSGDSVNLSIYYVNNSAQNTQYTDFTKSTAGNVTTVTMPSTLAQGNYTLHVSGSGSSGNYSWSAVSQGFKVKGLGISIDASAIKWQCNSKEIIGNYTADNPYVLVYTGDTYRFTIDASVLSSHGVKIDTTKSGTTGGYSGTTSAINAQTAVYSVIVHLTNLDSTYESYSGTFTLYYRIDRAKYDLSGLSWPTSNTTEYNRNAQSMELQGVFPQGLTATYTGDVSKTKVGDYTTTVAFNVADVNNYFVPTAGDASTYDGDFEFSFDWKIIEATINVSWKNDNNGNVTQYTWPTLNNLPIAGMVDYTYYKGDEQVATLPNPDDVTEETTYRVVATLNAAYSGNYKLSTGDSAEYTFTIGKDKFVVKLTLKWNGEDIQGKQLSYTGSAYAPSIEILVAGNGSVSASDITLQYYKDGAASPITGEPTDVGTYKIEVVLNSDKAEDNYINNNCVEFSFEITKAIIDTSAIAWGYTTDGEHWTAFDGSHDLPYSRADGNVVSYTVGLINVPEILKDYITYSAGRTQSSVNSYSTQYSIGDLGSNYEKVDISLPKLDWSIVTRMLAAPSLIGSWDTFDGEMHDFAEMYGLEEGWENYITISATRDGQTIDGHTAIKAGAYSIKFDLIDYEGTDWNGSVRSAYPLTVSPYEIQAVWQGSNTSATLVLESWIRSYIDYRFTDVDGNVLANGIRDMQEGVAYLRVAYVKENNEYNIDHNDIKIIGDPKTVFRGSAEIDKPVFDLDKVITYDGTQHSIEEFLVGGAPSGVKFDIDGDLINAGEYKVAVSLADESFSWNDETASKDSYTVTIKIAKATITQNKLNWTTGEDGIPKLTVRGNSEIEFTYKYYDADGYELTLAEIADGMECVKVVAKLNNSNYEMIDASNNVVEEVTYSPNDSEDPNGGLNGENPSDDNDNSPFDFSKVTEALKQWWQVIASAISIVLIIAFTAKGIDYASKKKENKRLIDSKYSAYAVGLFGITMTNWTIIACTLMGVAVLSFIFMLLEKSGYKKSKRELEDAKEEYARNKEEMMYMRMMGGQPNMSGGMGGQGFAYAQPMVGIGADEIRGIVADTMNNMLPNVTQYLPQEASYNDELIQQLVEQNAQNEERIRQLTQENEERIRHLTEQNEQMMEKLMEKMTEQPKESVNEDVIEKLVEKLANQQAEEKEAEKEVASTVVNEKTLEELKETIRQEVQSLINTTTVKTVEKDSKDEKIEMLMRNQEMLMRQMMEMVSRNNDKQVVMPYMSQPSERLMEKMIDLATKSAEKSVDRYVPVPVEKVVEKEVVKEVPVEKIVEVPVEVEKVVEKVVPMPVEKPAPKAKKAPTPRLTLDEAYAKLSATQKKIFDTLKAYALTKDKCKEKKSTYFIVLGQSTVNPLVKLTIKKNTTVALFKMEDEYMKDIRKNATSDGTKVKVKETELVVGDNQALSTAKDMIDLREDQIERYGEYLKEQRSFKKK